jgi:excisionase family DNA binding protein
MAMPQSYISLTEAAARKGVHYQTVRRAIARGHLRAMQVGGGVMIAPEDLAEWHPQYKHTPRLSRRAADDTIPAHMAGYPACVADTAGLNGYGANVPTDSSSTRYRDDG